MCLGWFAKFQKQGTLFGVTLTVCRVLCWGICSSFSTVPHEGLEVTYKFIQFPELLGVRIGSRDKKPIIDNAAGFVGFVTSKYGLAMLVLPWLRQRSCKHAASSQRASRICPQPANIDFRVAYICRSSTAHAAPAHPNDSKYFAHQPLLLWSEDAEANHAPSGRKTLRVAVRNGHAQHAQDKVFSSHPHCSMRNLQTISGAIRHFLKLHVPC